MYVSRVLWLLVTWFADFWLALLCGWLNPMLTFWLHTHHH